ncbi:MAG: hypothetical protein ABSH45_04605 [Bryobacteraceae bacterium]
MNDHVLHGETAAKEAEPHFAAKFDAAAEGSLQGAAQTLAVLIGVDVGRGETGGDDERERDEGKLESARGVPF